MISAMGHLLVLFVALPTAVVAEELSTLRSTHRLRRSFGERKGHMWGRCSEWDAKKTGCNLQEDMCNDHLSEGPIDSDVEIMIGGLPSSSSSNEVHLQWWSARKSITDYTPLESPYGATIYRNVLKAYPSFSDPEFNGGNVRVSESGQAVIRIQTPSTYTMHRWIIAPHIHLRVCSNESYAHDRHDTVFFSTRGPKITSGCKSNDIPYKILAYREVGAPNWTVPEGAPAFATTASATSTAATTTTRFPETASDGDVLVDLRVETAREALDLDALEFSPVYYCFLEGKFYDHFSASCAETCPEGSEVRHGQCVRPEAASIEAVTLKASWRLHVECGSRCWDETKDVKLHHLRLAAAEHLDVPFQEVAKVSLEVLDAAAVRRLDTTKLVRLSVIVVSRRVTVDDEALLRNGFITDVDAASELMGQKVHSFDASHEEAGDVAESLLDPYSDAYQAIETPGPSSMLANSPTSLFDLPFWALIGGAAAAIVLGMAVGAYIYRKRKQSLKRQQEASIGAAKGVEFEADKLGAPDVAKAKAEVEK